MPPRALRLRLLGALAAALLLLSACGGDDDDSSDEDSARDESDDENRHDEDRDDEDRDEGDDDEADEPSEAPVTEPVAAPASTGGAVLGAERDPTAFVVGDKVILLDGFLGVRLPEGWAVSTAIAPEPSVSPPGGETEANVEAIEQVLVIGPQADPQAATFMLFHYSHSPAVPGMEQFADGIREVVGADGTQFSEGQSATIGGQEALLHRLHTTDGDDGLFITLNAGGEYFFMLSIVSDDTYADEASELVASISLEPEAIG